MPIILLIAAMVIGLNVGVGIVLSQYFGRRDTDAVRHTLANAAYLVGTVYPCLHYYRRIRSHESLS